jgi:hypothetical protein
LRLFASGGANVVRVFAGRTTESMAHVLLRTKNARFLYATNLLHLKSNIDFILWIKQEVPNSIM